MKPLIEQFYDNELKRKPNGKVKKNHKLNIIEPKRQTQKREVVKHDKAKKHK
jgi:hypothetical protein